MYGTWYSMLGMLEAGLDVEPIVTAEYDLEKFEEAIGTFDRVHDLVVVQRRLGLDEDEGEEAALDGDRIKTSGVAENHAALLELADPLQDREGRHLHSARDLGIRRPGVLLQDLQDLEVVGVHRSDNTTEDRRSFEIIGRIPNPARDAGES